MRHKSFVVIVWRQSLGRHDLHGFLTECVQETPRYLSSHRVTIGVPTKIPAFKTRPKELIYFQDNVIVYFDQIRVSALQCPLYNCLYFLRKRPVAVSTIRSEEHTSELQSLRHLVCRL